MAKRMIVVKNIRLNNIINLTSLNGLFAKWLLKCACSHVQISGAKSHPDSTTSQTPRALGASLMDNYG
jgi:hypothetical protein